MLAKFAVMGITQRLFFFFKVPSSFAEQFHISVFAEIMSCIMHWSLLVLVYYGICC